MTVALVVSLIVAILGCGGWALRAYIVGATSTAQQGERDAGAAQNELDAEHEEDARIDRSNAASDSVQSTPTAAPDIQDRDGGHS